MNLRMYKVNDYDSPATSHSHSFYQGGEGWAGSLNGDWFSTGYSFLANSSVSICARWRRPE